MGIESIEALRWEDIKGDIPPLEDLGDADLKKLWSLKRDLEDREKNYGILYYQPMSKKDGHNEQAEFHADKRRVRAIFGGNQCIAGETIIYDPECGDRKVEDIRGKFKVLAWDGKGLVKADALRPFKKETDDLYDIVLSNGKKFTCSLFHRVLTPFGYKTVFDVIGSYGGVLLGSNLEPGQLVHGEDAHCSLKKAEDLKCRCFSDSCQCDEQPLEVEGNAQDVSPLQDDEEGRISLQASLRKGGFVDKGECIRAYRRSFRPSNPDVFQRYEDLYADILSGSFCKPCKSVSGLPTIARQSNDESCPRKSKNESDQADNLYGSTIPYKSPPCNIVTTYLAVISIAYKRRDVKWDFEVPKYHNYWLSGAIHHNSGKTESCCAEGIRVSLGLDPYKKLPVPNFGRVVATDLDKGIGEVIVKKYQKLVPMSEVARISKYSGGQWKKIFWKNFSTTEFMSYEQESKMFEGWTGHWVQFDEPPPREIYIACLRGLVRNRGIMWFGLTPLNQPWLYDDIVLKASKTDENAPSVYFFDMRKNKYLSKEAVDDFESKLSDDEKEARMRGKFKHLSGLVYKEFGAVHRVKSVALPKECTVYCAMDYHSRTPCAIVWIAVDEKGICYLYDELWIDKTIKGIAEAIVAKEKQFKKADYRFIDSISATPDRITGKSAQREFASEGSRLGWSLNFRSSVKNWLLGKDAVEQYLKVKNDEPGIYFFEDKCPRAIEGMTHYLWDEHSGVAQGVKEKPGKLYGHFPDAIRYILVMKPSFKRAEPIDDRTGPPSSITGCPHGG